MKVIDSDSGKEFHLHRTAELLAEQRAFYESACGHPNTEVRRKVHRNGATAYANQCLTCGRYVGQAVAKANAPQNASDWDQSSEARYDDARKREEAKIYQKHVRIQRGHAADFDQLYNEYLRTEKWKSKRAKVLQRASGICEGCLERPAVQVHHLSYENVFNEFMFELVAICLECHERAHKRSVEQHSVEDEPDFEAMDEWGDGHVCDSCRWSGEHSNRRWCFVIDKSAAESLVAGGECGPERSVFEELR